MVELYTMLESIIFTVVFDTFITVGRLTRVPLMAPFEACFNLSGVGSTSVGPAMPSIDLLLGSKSVVWRLVGTNMVMLEWQCVVPQPDLVRE